MSQRKHYPSDLNDAEWELIKPLIPKPKPRGPKKNGVFRTFADPATTSPDESAALSPAIAPPAAAPPSFRLALLLYYPWERESVGVWELGSLGERVPELFHLFIDQTTMALPAFSVMYQKCYHQSKDNSSNDF